MASGNRISNVDIEKFFEDERNDDLKKLHGCVLLKLNSKIYKLLRNN